MRIGIIIGRIGGVDGVALETEKWIEVLWRQGHEVYILSGQYEGRNMDPNYESLLAVLSFFSPECMFEQSKAFFEPEIDPKPLLDHIEKTSDTIAKEILWWVTGNKLDLIISENASALPCHLSMGIGIEKAVKHTGIKIITHDHDYAWERGSRYRSKHKVLNSYVEKHFPLQLPDVTRAVININAQNDLKEKFKFDSIVVPNVMDFDVSYGEKSSTNRSLRKDIGVEEDDILLFQITRIVRRKGIETAIDLIKRLDDPKVKLVITGNYNDDNDGEYSRFLFNKIKDLDLEDKVIFAFESIARDFNSPLYGKKMYSLSDAYSEAAACTYFSTYEGFGNAFVEAVLAKTPIFVNNYKPVYWPDIGSKGFKAPMIENSTLTDEKVEEMKEIIYNKDKQKEVADFNFELGKKFFSYDALGDKLDKLINLSMDDYLQRIKNTISI
ncbi:MAG: glycosyltransferase family 4 protein [Bacteroidota bacterium]|nr:glycosyltransferase family 4 protein [Bacteroidota bacterium]